MSLVNKLHDINHTKPIQREKYEESKYMKAVIITMINDSYSSHLSRIAAGTIQSTKSLIDYTLFPATVPDTITDDLEKVSFIKEPSKLKWSWPIDSKQDGYCLSTGLYKKAYAANDQRKVIACMVSHMRAWQHCIDINQPLMILEHDVVFYKRFSYTQIESQFSGGVVGLNLPLGATRKARKYEEGLLESVGDVNKRTLTQVPSVDNLGDIPLPQGLAGNSAYIIKPWAAKELLKKVEEIGMWPNDALMCKQLFPWMQQVYPYYCKVYSKAKSTTTG